MSAEDDLPDIDLDSMGVDELDSRMDAYHAGRRAREEAARLLRTAPRARDELDDRTGFERPPTLGAGWWYSRVLKERHPLWLPFRFLTQCRPQQIVSDPSADQGGSTSPRSNDGVRHSGYICYVWDYESEIQRMMRFTRPQMSTLLNQGFQLSTNPSEFKWLAHWEFAPDRRFGQPIFRKADDQPSLWGIVNAQQVIEACNRRLNEMPAILDRRRNPPPEEPERELIWGEPARSTRPPGRPITNIHGDTIGEIVGVGADRTRDQNLIDMIQSLQQQDDVQFGTDTDHSGGTSRPPRRSRQPKAGPQIQPPPGQIGGRKLDLS